MSETGFRKYILFWSSAQTSLERTELGQERKTRQTVAPFNAPSEVHLGSPDSRDSLSDAGDPAKEEKRQEGHRGAANVLDGEGKAGTLRCRPRRELLRTGRPLRDR